jgi:hypothetical protein
LVLGIYCSELNGEFLPFVWGGFAEDGTRAFIWLNYAGFSIELFVFVGEEV